MILAQLDGLDSSVVQKLYQRMAASNSMRRKILGLSGLIREGGLPALASAVEGFSSFEGYPQETSILLLSIRDDYRLADPSSISVLAKAIAADASPNLRVAAAHALASIHTKAALPYLASLMDDASATLRAEGIGGIGAFANGMPIQTTAGEASLQYLQRPEKKSSYSSLETMQNFVLGEATIAQHEATYLSFWKAWWQQHRSELGF